MAGSVSTTTICNICRTSRKNFAAGGRQKTCGKGWWHQARRQQEWCRKTGLVVADSKKELQHHSKWQIIHANFIQNKRGETFSSRHWREKKVLHTYECWRRGPPPPSLWNMSIDRKFDKCQRMPCQDGWLYYRGCLFKHYLCSFPAKHWEN